MHDILSWPVQAILYGLSFIVLVCALLIFRIFNMLRVRSAFYKVGYDALNRLPSSASMVFNPAYWGCWSLQSWARVCGTLPPVG